MHSHHRHVSGNRSNYGSFILKERSAGEHGWYCSMYCRSDHRRIRPPEEVPLFPFRYCAFPVSMLGLGMEGVLSTYGMDMVDPDIAIGIREAASFVVYFVAILPLAAGLPIFFAAFGAKSLWIVALAGFFGGLSYLAWSLPSMIMLRKAVKPRLLALFIGICAIGIVLVGYLFNALRYFII